jgi:hypothetical protein
MIFGFNTDVKHGGTVYHVQSEARENERLLQTQVFVRGRCIGKQTISYEESSSQADLSEKKMEEMLRSQHRSVLDAVREGRLDMVLKKSEPELASSPHPGLKLQWLNSDSIHLNGTLKMRFLVKDAGSGVEGARVTSRVTTSQRKPLYCQGLTDNSGAVELTIPVTEADLFESAVLVQATHSDRAITRKFHLYKASKPS